MKFKYFYEEKSSIKSANWILRYIDLFEYIEPTYPSGIKTSTVKKSGVQGSVIPIKQYRFTTSKGNDVKVHFKRTEEEGMKSADVVFYVNDTLDDSSSSKDGYTV